MVNVESLANLMSEHRNWASEYVDDQLEVRCQCGAFLSYSRLTAVRSHEMHQAHVLLNAFPILVGNPTEEMIDKAALALSQASPNEVARHVGELSFDESKNIWRKRAKVTLKAAMEGDDD